MGHLPSFFVPTPGDLTAQESPPPGNLPSKAKKMLMPWAQLELTDALLVMGCNVVNGSAHWRSEKDKGLAEELENPMGSMGL